MHIVSRRHVARMFWLLCLPAVWLPLGSSGAQGANVHAAKAKAAPSPSITLTTSNPGNIFAPTQPVTVTVTLAITSGPTRPFTLTESEQDFSGTATSLLTATVTLAAHTPQHMRVALPTHGMGYYELDLSLIDQTNQKTTTKSISIGVITPRSATPDPTSAFGVAGSLTQAYGSDPRSLAAAAAGMAAAGIRYDREEFNWDTIERKPGRGYQDFHRTDEAVIAARDAGIQVLGLLDYWGMLPQPDTTSTYSGTTKLLEIVGCSKAHACAYTPSGEQWFAQYAAEVVARYKPGGVLARQQHWTDSYGITSWEVWNEPSTISFWRHDLPGYGDIFAAMYRAAGAAIRAADPTAKVMYDESGSTIDNGLAANGSSHDILAIHSYSGALDPDSALTSPTLPRGGQGTAPAAIGQFVAARQPVWITETGYATNGSITPRQQADYLVRTYANFLAGGVRKIFWFKFHADAPGGDNAYSLVNRDLSPKPAYLAYAAMSRHLTGTTFAQSVQLGTAVHADLFGGNGSTVAVLWSTGDTGTLSITSTASLTATTGITATTSLTATTTLTPTAGLAAAYDLMDNSAGQQNGAVLTVPLSGDPLFLAVSGVTPAQLAGTLQAAQIGGISPASVDPHLVPGLVNGLPDVKVTVSARTNVPISGTVTLQLPAGWTAEPAAQPYATLQPGQSATVTFHLTSEVSHLGDTIAASATLPVAAPGPGGPDQLAAITGTTPVTAYTLSYGHPRIDGTLASWTDASESDLVNLRPSQVVGIPGWTPRNLSARVYTMWDEQYFYLAADVHDEHFDYAPVGFNLYQGDSIQYGWGMDPAAWNRDSGPNRFNVTAGLTYQGAANYQYNILSPWADMLQAIKPDPTTGDLIYTTAIPWSRLGHYLPKVDNQFAFDLLINQNENHNRVGWIQFTPGMGIGFYTSQFPLWTLIQSNPAAGLYLGGPRAPLQGALTFTLPAAHGHVEIHDGGMSQITLTVNGAALTLAPGAATNPLQPYGATSIDLQPYLHAGSNTVQVSGTPSHPAAAAALSFFQ